MSNINRLGSLLTLVVACCSLLTLSSCGRGLCAVTGSCSDSTVPITCATNYVAVGRNSDVGVSQAFCAAKYEMKIVGLSDGNELYSASFVAESRASGTAWVAMSRDQAIAECQALGTGFDLISNAQWQALAREIEGVTEGGAYVNWSNGSTSGANAINRGNSDGSSTESLAASDDSNPCFGTGNPNCANNAHADFTQKRTHTLSSGGVIWDVAGNAYEWVKLDVSTMPPLEGSNNYISQQPWTSALNRPTVWGPAGSYTAKNSGEYGGLGYATFNSPVGTVLRGGFYNDFTNSGVFAAELNQGALLDMHKGFRCVYIP
jgi:hypothetical protein